MHYIGLDKQIRKNNFNSILLLIAFPALLLGMLYAITWAIVEKTNSEAGAYSSNIDTTTTFLQMAPFVLGGVGVWFLIAWAGNAAFIRMATGSKTLERMEL